MRYPGACYALCLFLISSALSASAKKVVKPQQQQPSATNTQPAHDERGTEKSPSVVEVKPIQKNNSEAEQDAKDRDQKPSRERWTIAISAILALIALLQLGVYAYQSYKLKQTVESAAKQSEAMERHIGEASRSATAMENIATAIKAGNKAVLRAYLTVTVGGAIFQERREGQFDLRFEGKPNLVNTGNTYARKVRIRTAAAILPVPYPADFTFDLPTEEPREEEGVVGPHQTYILSGIVEGFVPDSEVAAIKEGAGKVLVVWGLITYEDVFGDTHFTRFAQALTWLPNGNVFGHYIRGQNDAN